jgi:hypothetical protein
MAALHLGFLFFNITQAGSCQENAYIHAIFIYGGFEMTGNALFTPLDNEEDPVLQIP